MFANLGIESEHRDAHKRQTGRRHAPREMTTESGGTEATASNQAATRLREEQMNKANAGPSFMDQMFDKQTKRSSGQLQHGTGVNRPTSTPKDQLNLFAWDSNPAAQKSQGRGTTAASTPAVTNAAAPPVVNDETLRRAEARKFEQNTSSNFLAFNENKKGEQQQQQQQQHTGKRMNNGVSRQQGGVQAPFATDNAGQATAEQQQQQRRGKKGPPPTRQGDGNAVQGFKGMGEQCNSRPSGRKAGKVEPSQVFPPSEPTMEGAPLPPSQQAKYVPERPIWLQSDVDDKSHNGAPAQQRSVKFADKQDEDEPHAGDAGVYDDDRYYVDSDEAYFREQQMLYEQQQQQQQQDPQRRVLQFKRHSRHGEDEDGNDDAFGH